MATLKNMHEFEGSIGNIVAYKRYDSNKTYLRTKNGVSKKRIQNDKAFERTRQQNKEWSGCAKAASMIRSLLANQRAVADYNISGPLTAISKHIQARDEVNKHGERAILFSQHGKILEGFQLNHKNSFESILRGNVSVIFNRAAASLQASIPELIPGISLIAPTKLSAYYINLTFGTLPDLFYTDAGYAITGTDTTHNQLITSYNTPWYFTHNNVPAQTIDLTLQSTNWLHPTDLLVASISIHFGTQVTNDLFSVKKHVGGGKVLWCEGAVSC